MKTALGDGFNSSLATPSFKFHTPDTRHSSMNADGPELPHQHTVIVRNPETI
jgi:hypothetical protein